MANPAVTEIPKNVWTKVATNVTAGFISKCDSDKSKAPTRYLQTYRTTGDATPIADGEGVLMFQDHPETEEIKCSFAIDIYISARAVDGELRMDV